MNTAEKRIESVIAECELHIRRLRYVTEKIAIQFPSYPEIPEPLSDEAVTHIDQFLFRFMKLQDAMGARLFPLMADMISGDSELRPFIDTLNILEKHMLIPSRLEWQNLRNLRNTLAHEYPGSEEETAEAIGELLRRWNYLEKVFADLRDYYIKRLKLT